jgi:DNA (cytosine-5)-methyltransferase 1
LVDECRPDIFIWENVKGAFSSNNGADFWAIIQAFANIGGYRFEWQLLNTAWVLPQNRERIYLIGHLAGRSKPGVFPFRENDIIFDWQEKTRKRQSQTQNCTTISTKNGNRSTDTFVSLPKKSGTLTAGGNSGGLHSDMLTIEIGTLRTHNDGNGFRKIKGENAPTIPARAREDGSGQPVIKIIESSCIPVLTPDRLEKRQNGRRFKENNDPSFTLTSQDKHGVLLNESKIRRLTEIECERLQGFPDNWTKFGDFDGEIKEIKKTQRFKLIGNAVSTKIVKIIALRLI